MEKSRNIVCNDCVGARIYQEKNCNYRNPFAWCLVHPKDFAILYKNYNTINFKKYRLAKDGQWYKIIVDEKFAIYYPHYRYDPNSKEPKPKKPGDLNIYYDKIEDYIKDRYERRVERMSGEPIFLIDDNETDLIGGRCAFSEEDLKKYVDRDDCIISTSNRNVKGKNVVYKPLRKISTGEVARIILNKTDIWK
jgi:uncharacterized protein (DUF1919 family)